MDSVGLGYDVNCKPTAMERDIFSDSDKNKNLKVPWKGQRPSGE
jgi:hypothetical protein